VIAEKWVREWEDTRRIEQLLAYAEFQI